MKSTIVNPATCSVARPYPKLMKSKTTGNIYLVLAYNNAICVNNKNAAYVAIGETMTDIGSCLVDLPTGTKVILEND